MYELFPLSIDKLGAERGHFRGPAPALMPDDDPAAVSETMLNADAVGMLEFGANQVVLIRSTRDKSTLPLELQRGLVLTVEESKGLEFDDVCVYNFCFDSPARREWRVLNTLALEPGAPQPGRGTAFDETQDRLLCEELKQLYVALTRARKRCFLFDEDMDVRQPLFDYLHRCGVAENGLEQQQGATTTKAAVSTAADWRARGQEFSNQQLFGAAERCFLHADDYASALDAGGRRLWLEGQTSRAALALVKSATLRRGQRDEIDNKRTVAQALTEAVRRSSVTDAAILRASL